MTKLVLLAVTLLVFAGRATAQPGGVIGIFDTPASTNCDLIDSRAIQLCSYYVIHQGATGVTGCQFMIVSEHGGVWMGDTHVFPVTLGDSQTGLSIAYGECLTSPIHILTLNYFCQGFTPACATFQVVSYSTATQPGLLAVDCMDSFVEAAGLTSRINSDGSCTCKSSLSDSSWGRVKALYTNQ